MTAALLTELAQRFRWPAGSGVLLAGSVAEGVAMRGSNVNIVVLEAPAGWVPAARERPTTRPMSLADNHIYPGDPVVSLELPRPQRLHELAGLAGGMMSIQDSRTPDLCLPVLDVLEIRLLARLRSGRVLHGHDTVARWRDLLRVSWLPAFHCATTYLTAVHFHRKALTAHRDRLPVDASVLPRLAIEHLLLSALAAGGRVLHEVKNLGRTIAASRREISEPPRVLAEAGELLCLGPPRDHPISVVGELATDLLGWLPTAPHGPVAAEYLRGQQL